jgi:hypothetical protein
MMTDDEREVRAARNESLFRALNERLEQVREGTQPDEATDYFCECAQRTCASTVQLTPDEYEHARADGNRFIVMPGHLVPDAERITEQHERYWLVEKLGVGSYVADALDPRA